MIAFWTILVGILAGVSCSLVGCYLVLRKMSLLGDAISHAVLPGIALGFLLSGKISGPAIVMGAMVMGLLTAYLTQALSKAVKVPEDASLGVVFTTLFALGVVLISVKARNVDLDPGCVLYGLIEFTPFDTTSVFRWEIPQAALTLGATTLFVLVAIILCWKELKLASFDPELSTSLGYPASLLHYFLMALTAGVTVAAFEAVGSILVVAMLIVPAATAQLLTDRLRTMLLVASLLATASAILGYWGGERWNTSVAGMMAVSAGGLFFIALMLAPKYGLVAKLVKQLGLTFRILREDVLGTLYRNQERHGIGLSGADLLPGQLTMVRWMTLKSLVRRQLVNSDQGTVSLTKAGQDRALQLVRAHRLWETYLQQNVALPADHLHAPAEKMEHYVGPVLLDSIAEDLHQPAQDPHGREIPAQHSATNSGR
ncbi:MAG TPA: metal ABC transporter permease [Gemmatales bacterium]|nr:metal ABC transporter permease [Gemmatales bacterium]